MNKAIFLDLDHTLIHPLEGRLFPADKNDWEFKQETIDYLQNLTNLDSYSIFIVSNQGGIELGYSTEEETDEKLSSIAIKMHELGLPLIQATYCPTMEGYNRKPNPGAAFELASEFQLDLSNSIMVGDLITDEQFAKNAGIGTYVDVRDI